MMPGRESEYERGFIKGVEAVYYKLLTGEIETLDKFNAYQYAMSIINEEMEKK
jgi:hypothetical protein